MVVLSASDFESLVETVDVLRAFPDLEDDISEAEGEYRKGNYTTLDKVLADEGYIKITGGKKGHELRSHSAKKGSR